MSINFNFATSTSALPVQTPVPTGTLSNTGGTSIKTFYVSHDSPSDLENVAFYLQPFSGTGYVGIYGQAADYLTYLEWGLATDKGMMLNQDIGATSTASDVQFKGGSSPVGDSITNGIPLSSDAMIAGVSTSNGHFPTGGTSQFALKISIPATETAAGRRYVSMFMAFEV